MDIKAEDFPLYQLYLKLNQPGIERATAYFNKAVNGNDDDKFNFALGIQTGTIPPFNNAPGQTADMDCKTQQSCLAVFRDLASRGHEGAALMVENYEARDLGAPRPSLKKKINFDHH